MGTETFEDAHRCRVADTGEHEINSRGEHVLQWP
jgi:hypothetical protein